MTGRLQAMPVIRLEPDTEETLNRHDFWRGCYATMLSELSIEHIKEFFDDLPMVMGGRPIEGVDLLRIPGIQKGLRNRHGAEEFQFRSPLLPVG